MKTQRNEKCPCGSGKKFKQCCLFKNQRMGENDPFLEYEVPDYTGVIIYYGFDKTFTDQNPFEIDYEKACCYVIQANKYVADEKNHMLKFRMLKPGDWFVMGDVGTETQYSFKYKTAEQAMDIAKEKFAATRFLAMPDFI